MRAGNEREARLWALGAGVLGSGAQAAGDRRAGFAFAESGGEGGAQQLLGELVEVGVGGGGELGEPEGGAVERVVAPVVRAGDLGELGAQRGGEVALAAIARAGRERDAARRRGRGGE